jgi:gamma-glutamyltranspeptidase/glutathione hydrolase
MIDFGAANTPVTNIGSEHPNVDADPDRDPLVNGLRALGHTVGTGPQNSGLGTIIVRTTAGGERYYEGGADPRREGIALGDTFRP